MILCGWQLEFSIFATCLIVCSCLLGYFTLALVPCLAGFLYSASSSSVPVGASRLKQFHRCAFWLSLHRGFKYELRAIPPVLRNMLKSKHRNDPNSHPGFQASYFLPRLMFSPDFPPSKPLLFLNKCSLQSDTQPSGALHHPGRTVLGEAWRPPQPSRHQPFWKQGEEVVCPSFNASGAATKSHGVLQGFNYRDFSPQFFCGVLLVSRKIYFPPMNSHFFSGWMPVFEYLPRVFFYYADSCFCYVW